MTTGWFEGAVRPEVVASHLTRCVPEFATGGMVLLGCRITRIRSAPANGAWTAIYQLDVRDPATGGERTVAADGNLTPPGVPLPRVGDPVPFGTDGWRVLLADLRLDLRFLAFDHALPGLGVITDPEQARVLLGELLHGAAPDGARSTITSCVATVVSHKPGVRATVVCRLGYAEPSPRTDAPASVVVKVHRNDEGRRAHEVMLALEGTGLASSPVLGLARPSRTHRT